MKKTVIHIFLALFAIAFSAIFPVSAIADTGDGGVVIIDPIDNDENKRTKMPSARTIVVVYYQDGVLSCPDWGYQDEEVTVELTPSDTEQPLTFRCHGSILAAGIIVGIHTSFTLVITADSGPRFTGRYESTDQ